VNGSPSIASFTQAGFINPQALMSIRNLEFRARVVMEGFWTGLHRSPYHGFSVEFSEYRSYTPGDDPRYLDWRLYARSDRYFIKRFHEETNLRCHIIVDRSRSMDFGTVGFSKAQYANTLAATFAHFLFHQGDAVGLLCFGDQIKDYLPARHRAGHLRHLIMALEKPSSGSATNLDAPLKRIGDIIKKRSMIIVISDFMTQLDHFDNYLAGLSVCGHELLVFQILDPAEIHFNMDQSGQYVDMESQKEIYIDPAIARKNYLKRMEAHVGQIRSSCQSLGIAFQSFAIDRPLELALFDFLRARGQRGKLARAQVSSRQRTHPA
jgi:uncharacterized protein (DUF58 family)